MCVCARVCVCACVCVCVCMLKIATHNNGRKHCAEAVSRESDLGSHTSSDAGLGLHSESSGKYNPKDLPLF